MAQTRNTIMRPYRVSKRVMYTPEGSSRKRGVLWTMGALAWWSILASYGTVTIKNARWDDPMSLAYAGGVVGLVILSLWVGRRNWRKRQQR